MLEAADDWAWGRYAGEKRIQKWLQRKRAEDITWTALEPRRKGFRNYTNVVTVGGAGFDGLTKQLIEDVTVWGPHYDSKFPHEFLDRHSWIKTAKDILKSVRILETQFNAALDYSVTWKPPYSPSNPFPDFSVGYTYLMLAGYVLENVFKAAIVRDYRYEMKQEFDDTGQLPEQIRKHDLYALAAFLNIKVDSKEEWFLRRVTQCVEWYGKYPVPSRPRATMVRFSTGHSYNLRLIARSDPKYFEELLEKLVSECGFNGLGLEKESGAGPSEAAP